MDRVTAALGQIKNNFNVNSITIKPSEDNPRYTWAVVIDIAPSHERGLPFYQHNLFTTLDEGISFLERFTADYKDEINTL